MLVVGLVLGLIHAAAALDAASVGVIDWQWKQTGAPHTSIALSAKRQVWATDQDVVAGVATRSGRLDWRFVLPEGESLVSVAAGPQASGSVVDVLSSTASGCLLRRVDADGGAAIWDVLVKSGSPSPALEALRAASAPAEAGSALGFGIAHDVTSGRVLVSCDGLVSSVPVDGSTAGKPSVVGLDGGAAVALVRSAAGPVAVGLASGGDGAVVSATRSSPLAAATSAASFGAVELPGWPEAGCADVAVAAGPDGVIVACRGTRTAAAIPASGAATAITLPSAAASVAASLTSARAPEGGAAAWAAVVTDADGAVTAVLLGPDGTAAPLPKGKGKYTAAAVACRPEDAAAGVAVILAGPRSAAGTVTLTVAAAFHGITLGGQSQTSAVVAAAGEGRVLRLLPVVAVSRASRTDARLRAVLVSDDAAVTSTGRDGNEPLWSRDESRASVRSVVSVEPPLPEADRLTAGSLTLSSRLAGQIEEARHFAAGLADAAAAFAANPEHLIDPVRGRAVIGRAFPTLTDRTGGQAFDRTLIFTSKPGRGMRPVISAALALPSGSDDAVWRRALPFARRDGDAIRVPAAACADPSLHVAVRREARTPAGNPTILVVLACPGGSVTVEVDAWTGLVTSAVKAHDPAPAFLSETGHLDDSGSAVFLAVAAPGTDGDGVAARFVPDQAPGPALDAALAALRSRSTVLTLPLRDAAGTTTGVAGFRLAARPDGTLRGERVWQASAAAGEEVLALSLPAPEAWQATQASELQQAKALADGSLLLEHKAELVALVTGTVQRVAAPADDADAEEDIPSVSLRLLDAATGRVSHAQSHLRAKGPVRLAWLSDTVAYSFWNDEAHRFELAVLSLFAGGIDSFDLNPLSAPAPALGGLPSGPDMAPLVRQQTFILPVSVARLATTATRHGVTAHALLVGLGSGGVLAIDRKLIDPRRPVGTPSANDQAEGLMPFDPALPLAHTQIITHAREVARLRRIDAEPTHMESASVVVATGLDVVVTRATPSAMFDSLDPDFSFLTVVGLLLVGAVAVVVARFFLHQSMLKRAWMSMSSGPSRSRLPGDIRRIIIVTCSTERQAEAVESELHARAAAGAFDDSPTLLFACPDPSSARVGSGGATFNALITVEELVSEQPDCNFADCLVFMIHSGGDSQRLPLQSVCGKAWSALPTLSPSLDLQAPIDLLITTMTRLFSTVRAGLVVASSDVLLLVPDTFRVDWPQDGATGLAIPSPKEIGPNHGVYQVDELPSPGAASAHAPVSRFFQKASVPELAAAGAVSPADEVLLDTGVIYFSPSTTSTLLDLARTAPLLSCTYLGLDTATAPLRVELYSDMMLAMQDGLGQPFASYRDMGTSDLNPERLVAGRGLLWQRLSPVPFYAAVATGGRFLHVGTTPEYRALLTRPSEARSFYSLRPSAACFDRTTHASVDSVAEGAAAASAASAGMPSVWFTSLNTVFESEGARGEGAVAEHCVLRGDWSLGAGAVASGVRTVAHLRLLPGIAAQESLVPEESAGLDADGETMATGASFESPARAALGAAAVAVGLRPAHAATPRGEARDGSLASSADHAGGGAEGTPLAAVRSDSGPALVPSALRVITVLAAEDPIKTQWRSDAARVCGATWEAFFRAAGVTDAEVWPDHVPEASRTLWTARLFPVVRPAGVADGGGALAGDGDGDEAGGASPSGGRMPLTDVASLWIQDAAAVAEGRWDDCAVASPAAVELWRRTERLSLRDVLQRADARAEFAWRRRLRGEVDARLVVEAVRRQSDVPLAGLLTRLGGASASAGSRSRPVGPAGGAAGLELVRRALRGLDRLAKGDRLDVAGRALAVQSALLWAVAGWGGHDQRSGPAANREWALALALLEGTQPGLAGRGLAVPAAESPSDEDGRARRQGVRLLATVRDSWLAQGHLAGRAARHVERASQLLTAQCVYTGPIEPPLPVEGGPGDGAAAAAAREEAAPAASSGGAAGPLASLVAGASPLPVGAWAVATCPARVDLAGGWSDTPPIHFEAGPVPGAAGGAAAAASAADAACAEEARAAADVAAASEAARSAWSSVRRVADCAGRGGGVVVNAGILIDGRRPVGTRARRCEAAHIVIRTRSSVRPDEATAAFRGAPASGLSEDADAAAAGVPGFVLSEVTCASLADVADYFKPTAQGSLVKSALLCLGLLSLPRRRLHEDSAEAAARAEHSERLEAQLRRSLGGGGLEIETWSDLPQGSGLGVSSILAGTVLAAVARCAGVSFSNTALTHLVLSLEQLLSTGGGYQDQVGGLCGGVHASVCAPGLPVGVRMFPLGADDDDEGADDPADGEGASAVASPASRDRLASFLDGRLFVMYTGISRLAKNLLQRVLRQWALRENGVTSTVAMLRANAVAMSSRLAARDAEGVGRCLERYWQQKQQMAPQAEPERVARMREVLRPFVHGSSLCGAGGGGFLVGVKRDEASLDEIRGALLADARTSDVEWTMHEVAIARTGLSVSVVE